MSVCQNIQNGQLPEEGNCPMNDHLMVRLFNAVLLFQNAGLQNELQNS